MKIITFRTDKSGITIRIPRTLINHVAKHHPENPVIITDSQDLLESVAEQIESGLTEENDGNSLTKFQALFDEAIIESAVLGRGADFKEE